MCSSAFRFGGLGNGVRVVGDWFLFPAEEAEVGDWKAKCSRTPLNVEGTDEIVKGMGRSSWCQVSSSDTPSYASFLKMGNSS